MRPVRVWIVGSNQKRVPGAVRVQAWDQKARLRRALKCLALCWGLAVVSVVLPIAHFVLVPGFLIAGPVGAHRMYASTSVVLGGEGTCPSCEAPFSIARGPDRWPLGDVCAKCHCAVTIEKAE